MKKLMFAVAALAAGAASAEIVSDNIVGYTDLPVAKYMFVATPFTQVNGGENFTIGDLKTNCDETGESGTGWVEVLDAVVDLSETGTFKRKIIYVPEWYADGEDYSKGWYDRADTDFEHLLDKDVAMPFGYGIQVGISGANGQEVTWAGEVKKTPTILDLSAGYWTIGNCAVTDLKLGDLITNCDETGESGKGWVEVLDAVVELSETGTFKRKLIYVPEWYADGEDYSKGWYDRADDDFTEELGSKIVIKGGHGFQVAISGSNGQKLTIKSALAK